MKNCFLLIPLLAVTTNFACAQPAPSAQTLLVEAESFQFRGDWLPASEGGASGGSLLLTSGGQGDALTVVSLPQSGNYNVWVRARDYAANPGARRFQVALDGALFAPEFGAHGTAGWKWEKAGARPLKAGDHVLAIHDTAHYFGRCDAILLTTGDVDPNAQSAGALAARRTAPKTVEAKLETPFAPVPPVRGAPREVAKLENETLRIRFLSATDGAGLTQITRETALKIGGIWRIVPAQDEKLWLQFAPQTTLNTSSYLPAWETPNAPAPQYAFEVGGQTYRASESGNNPFWAAPAQPLVARSARQSGPNRVEIGCETPDGTKASGRWELLPGARDARFSLEMTAPQSGFYSVGFSPFGAYAPGAVQHDLLPPLFQFQRLPASPVLVGSNLTPQPLALIQVAPDGFAPNSVLPNGSLPNAVAPNGVAPNGVAPNGVAPNGVALKGAAPDGGLPNSAAPNGASLNGATPNGALPNGIAPNDAASIALGVAAEPARLPFEWPNATNAVYGFSLLNAAKGVQPTIFAPVLGTPRSQFAAGAPISLSWRVISMPGDWKRALEYASNDIFGVTDYRKPYGVSLSDAALNMIGLIKSDASGWDPKLKGFLNIEAKNVASQASPLTVLSAAILTRDEELYQTRALPTIEYSLSRPGAHFGTAVPDTFPPYINQEGTQMQVPSGYFGLAYWQGLDELLGHDNPWLQSIAAPGGAPRLRTSFQAMPRWSETLAAYRLRPDAKTLATVQSEADAWLQSEVYARHTNELGVTPFYNMSFYPYWWDLLDLYELTHEKRYLDAAQEGAFYTIAGLWSHPRVPEGDITIHPDGEFGGEARLWYRGDKPYRLGYPRKAGDTPQKQVPAWLVAQMGLGLEQPSTYYGSGQGNFRNILMAAWAPDLLRLYRYTGREIYRTYARNAAISRFGNYPGYYLNGFTDLELSPRYPYDGPDVTSLYFHHIPAQLAWTLDFLVTEAQTRSGGKIDFPWSKGQGYVWFSNRIYGGAPGTVFGDRARLWLDARAAHASSNAINTLAARAQNRVWIVLMNEANAPTTTPLALDKNALGLVGDSYSLLDANGKATTAKLGQSLSVTVPAKGLVALSFAARPETQTPIPPLENGRVSQKLDGDWGTLEAFRIRSPFGKDSLYVVLTGRPKDGARATLQIEGEAPQECASYPFEFSVYPIAMDVDLKFSVQTVSADGVTGTSGPLALRGTARR